MVIPAPAGLSRALARIATIRSRFGSDAPPLALKDPSRASGAAGSDPLAAYLQASAPVPAVKALPKGRSGSAAPEAAPGLGPTSSRANGILLPAVERWRPLATAIGAGEGVDPNLLLALVQEESGGDPTVVSKAGAQGLTQLMPVTAKNMGVSDPFDPAQNLRGGARYLRLQFDRFGTLDLALASYNAGPNAVREHKGVPPFADTQRYVDTVMSLFGRLVAASSA